MGSVPGVLVGALLLGVTESLTTTFVSSALQELAGMVLFLLRAVRAAERIVRPRRRGDGDERARASAPAACRPSSALYVARAAARFGGNLYLMSLIVASLTIGGIALAWALLGNLGGLVSFGHAAFFGVGAYASALLVMKAGWPIALARAGRRRRSRRCRRC